jgi:glycosyltransferase involved in cell wall biosynthesis
MSPLITAVVPAYGRVGPLKTTLKSVGASVRNSGRPGEIIVVDDGSADPLEAQLAGFEVGCPVRFVRQPNQGSIVARLHGLRESKAEYITFIDSDDVIHPSKIGDQLAVMEKTRVYITYTDPSRVRHGANHEVAEFGTARVYDETTDSLTLMMRIQPPPHSAVFRKNYLNQALLNPAVPPHRIYDSCGEVWLYRNLALHRTEVRKVPGHYAGIGIHDEERVTNHWENIAVSALGVNEGLVAALRGRSDADAQDCRVQLGQAVFHGWRILPYDILPEFDRRSLAIWRECMPVPADKLGGRCFRILAGLIGWENAGRLMRRFKRPSYAQCKTLKDEKEFAELLTKLPAPTNAVREREV